MVPWCGECPEQAMAVGPSLALVCLGRRSKAAPAPSLELLFSLLLGGRRLPHALGPLTLGPLTPAFPSTLATPSPSPDQALPPDF